MTGEAYCAVQQAVQVRGKDGKRRASRHNGQIGGLVEIAVVEGAVRADAHQGTTGKCLDRIGAETGGQGFQVGNAGLFFFQLPAVAGDGNVGHGVEAVEAKPEPG